ncbi:VOC family protein [Aromatoleum toluolicum]|uniref:VOC family protein n=1 Tax=Aromatoleum toluolicum TaxID=90060 RepID=A0ABX1NNU5_9RHOO|nr:VOC family protein [Aromatoleum toluolicum]NMG00701.1 VOC family protein [Aromatoleum toluolicum]
MTTPQLGLKCVKGVALAVRDMARAARFYGETLGLPPASEGGEQAAFLLGGTVLMLKDDWYGTPTAEPNPRITLECADARALEATLRGLDVKISDAVELYDGSFYVGAFLDSEGNKLWFCSPG